MNSPRICVWCKGFVRMGPGPTMRPSWKRYQCTKCHTIAYEQIPTRSEIINIYNDAWNDCSKKSRFATGGTDEKIAKSLIMSTGYSGRGVCMDYGAGKGALSRELINMNSIVFAIEPYGGKLQINNKNFQQCSSLEDIPPGIKFDWIFLIEVIEHMIDPVSELLGLRNRLSPGGRLVISTPNALGWRARLEKFSWREAQNATHITLFTEKSLRICLDRAGFKKISQIKNTVDFRRGPIFVRLGVILTQKVGLDGGLRFVAFG